MTGHIQRGKAVGVALGCVLAVAACETDRTTVFDPIGPPAFDFGLNVNGNALLPSGVAAVGGSSVTLTLASLRAVSSGSYQFWTVARDAQSFEVITPAFGTILEFFLRDSTDAGVVVTDPVTGDPIQVTDTNEVSLTRTTNYVGTDDAAVFAIEVVVDSTDDGSNPAAANAVVVSLEGPGIVPGSAVFLWRRIATGGSGSLTFGNFGGSDVTSPSSPNDYVYPLAGGGQGGIRGSEIAVALQELSRPPVGFFYRGYLIDADGNSVMIDTLQAEWSADSSVSRVSLYNADDDPLLPGVSGPSITEAQIRNCVAGSGTFGCANTLTLSPSNANKPFADFVTFALILDPKGAPEALAGATVLTGEVPDEARN